MKANRLLNGISWIVSVSLVTVPFASAGSEQKPNDLTPEEKEAGWQLLFDGKTTTGWRGFGKAEFPDEGWTVEDGWLKHREGGGGGDIITVEQYADFELRFEWKADRGANSGVKYFIQEERGSAIGHEYQLLDPGGRGEIRPEGQTAGFYDVFGPEGVDVKPAGEINRSRIVVDGDRVEHWLNGEKVLEYTLGSEETRRAVADSKFEDVAGFGEKTRGHLLLQDHGDAFAFRNMKLRKLSPAKAHE